MCDFWKHSRAPDVKCLGIGSDLIIRDVNCEPQVSHAYSIFVEWERV